MGRMKEVVILTEDMQTWSNDELLDVWRNSPDPIEAWAASVVLVELRQRGVELERGALDQIKALAA